MSDRLSIRLSPEMRELLAAEVAATGKSESEVVRQLLRRHLPTSKKKEKTALDLAKRHRLIGCLRGGHGDLSTNRRHFEGFGQ